MSRLGPLTFLNEQGFVKQNMVNLDYLALFYECSRQVFFNEYASRYGKKFHDPLIVSFIQYCNTYLC